MKKCLGSFFVVKVAVSKDREVLKGYVSVLGFGNRMRALFPSPKEDFRQVGIRQGFSGDLF